MNWPLFIVLYLVGAGLTYAFFVLYPQAFALGWGRWYKQTPFGSPEIALVSIFLWWQLWFVVIAGVLMYGVLRLVEAPFYILNLLAKGRSNDDGKPDK